MNKKMCLILICLVFVLRLGLVNYNYDGQFKYLAYPILEFEVEVTEEYYNSVYLGEDIVQRYGSYGSSSSDFGIVVMDKEER